MSIKRQPKSDTIHPCLMNKRKKKLYLCILGFSCLPGSILLFHRVCCCQVPYSCSRFVRCWSVCWAAIIMLPYFLLPSFLPFPLTFFSFSKMRPDNLKISSISRYKGSQLCIWWYSDKHFYQTSFFTMWGIFVCNMNRAMLFLGGLWVMQVALK